MFTLVGRARWVAGTCSGANGRIRLLFTSADLSLLPSLGTKTSSQIGRIYSALYTSLTGKRWAAGANQARVTAMCWSSFGADTAGGTHGFSKNNTITTGIFMEH